MMPTTTSRVIMYPDQGLRPIKAKAAQRARDAANCMRRTARLAASQPAPKRAGADGQVELGASLPGEVPYKRTGQLVGAIGFDFNRKSASFDAVGKVTIAAHGWEVGRRGVKRPVLRRVLGANRQLFADILLGKRSAPHYGDVSFVTHRMPFTLTQKVSKTGKLNQSVKFKGPAAPGTFRFSRPRGR